VGKHLIRLSEICGEKLFCLNRFYLGRNPWLPEELLIFIVKSETPSTTIVNHQVMTIEDNLLKGFVSTEGKGSLATMIQSNYSSQHSSH
jgi:hypothetical protein